MTNYELYLKKFVDGSKALIKRNRIIDDTKETKLNKNVSFLLDYFKKSINQAINQETKEDKNPGDILFLKYWNSNTLYKLVSEFNFDRIKKEVKPGDKIQMTSTDFMSINDLENTCKEIWKSNQAKNDDEFKFMLDYDFSKKTNLIVRIVEFIPDYYKFKSNQETKKTTICCLYFNSFIWDLF